jgi:hypothetical protein
MARRGVTEEARRTKPLELVKVLALVLGSKVEEVVAADHVDDERGLELWQGLLAAEAKDVAGRPAGAAAVDELERGLKLLELGRPGLVVVDVDAKGRRVADAENAPRGAARRAELRSAKPRGVDRDAKAEDLGKSDLALEGGLEDTDGRVKDRLVMNVKPRLGTDRIARKAQKSSEDLDSEGERGERGESKEKFLFGAENA